MELAHVIVGLEILNFVGQTVTLKIQERMDIVALNTMAI